MFLAWVQADVSNPFPFGLFSRIGFYINSSFLNSRIEIIYLPHPRTYLLKCRVEESFDCYDKDEKKLIVYDVNTDKKTEIKIISVDKEKLKVEFNNEVMEFKLDE